MSRVLFSEVKLYLISLGICNAFDFIFTKISVVNITYFIERMKLSVLKLKEFLILNLGLPSQYLYPTYFPRFCLLPFYIASILVLRVVY